MKTFLIEGEKTFRITVDDDVKVTFGPWSPPNSKGYHSEKGATGTLRFYDKTKDNILACFGHVTSFRNESLKYGEQVAKEEGATIWKDSEDGYTRENKVSVQKQWVHPQLGGVVVTTGTKKRVRRRG